MSVFFLFLLATSLGALSTLYWIPEGDLGRGYFQMNALVVLGLLGLAAAVAWLHPFHPFGDRPAAGVTALAAALAGSFLYYAAIWQERWRLSGRRSLASLPATTGEGFSAKARGYASLGVPTSVNRASLTRS